MGFFKAVIRHSLLVIILWIILVTISAPAFIELNKLTEYRPEKLMPNGTESLRANDIVYEIMGEAGGAAALAYDIVIVKGVNASDPRLVDIDREINESIKEYVVDYSSPYRIIRDIYSEVDKEIYNYTVDKYDYINDTYYMLKLMYENHDEIIDQLNMSHTYLLMLAKYYDEVYENKSYYEELAGQMYENLSMLPDTYRNLSETYNATVEQMRGLQGLLTLTKYMLLAGDGFYSSTLGNLSQIYVNMTMLNSTIYMLNEMYYSVSLGYTMTLYNVLRIHYYLLYNTTAYTTGLNESIVEEVVNYTNMSGYPVDPSLVNETYRYVVEVYGVNNTNITILYMIASNIYCEELAKANMPPQAMPMYTGFLAVYNVTLLNISTGILTVQNTSYEEILFNNTVTGQLNLLNHLMSSREKALPVAVKLYADQVTPMIISFMRLPEKAYPVIHGMFISAYYAGHPLNYTMLENLVVEAMYNMTTLYTNTTLPYTMEKLFRGIYERGPVKEVVVEVLPVFLNETFTIAPPGLSVLVANTIVEVDSSGSYLFTCNESLTIEYSARIVSNMTGLPYNILYGLASGSLNEYRAAYELLEYMIVEETGMEELAPVIRIIYEYNGTVSYDGFRRVFEIMFTMMPMELPGGFNISFISEANMTEYFTLLADHIAYLVWNNMLTQDYTYRFLVGAPLVFMVLTMTNDTGLVDNVLCEAPVVNAIVNNTYRPGQYGVLIDTFDYIMGLSGQTFTLPGMGNIPVNMTISFDMVFEKLISLPENATKEDLVNALYEAFKDAMVNMTSEMGNFSAEDFREVLVEVLVEGRDPLDALTSLSAKYMPPSFDVNVFSKYLRKALEENEPMILYNGLRDYVHHEIFENITDSMKGRMISEDMSAFLIVISPRGGSEEEKANNAYKVSDLIRDILSRHGFKPSYIGVVGDDVLGAEIREISEKDIQRIQTISMIAPVIIALILIGGILATALPFLGIAASIAVATGIIYVLAYFDIITVTSWSRMLLTTTAFGLGMDYSSYIVLRFKEKLPILKDPAKTAYDAVKYAVPAIMAAASTDIIGFAVMKLAWEFPLIASIGETVPIAILVVLLVSLTLTPSLLALFGNKKWFWWPHKLEAGRAGWRGYRITRGRALALVGLSIIIFGFGLAGFTSFQGSHDYSVFMPENTPGYKAYLELQKTFPAGRLMPIYIVYILKEGYTVYDKQVWDDIRDIRARLLEIKGVSEVYGPTYPGDKPREVYISSDNKTFYLEVIIKPSPLSREGVDLTKEIKSYVKKHAKQYYKEVLVGGVSAASVEMEELLNNIFWHRVFPVAFILMWLAMSLSFHSVWPGLIALSTIVIGYMFGVSAASTLAGAYGQPTLWFLPLLALPAVLGVGMDYNSFYMNRQRYELMSGNDGYKASSTAISRVSHLVLGLGLIVTATYAGMITGSSWGIRELGTALATAVFTTTIMAAFILAPAILALMGEKAWWPGSRRWKRR